jgi:23S rRNA (guanosine2251-2'-O)-methyltransferase
MPNKQEKRDAYEVYLLLDNIRSVHNVGSIFRTADCAGVSKIFCVGTTPVPIDRFGRKRKDFAKVSLGAEKTVDWRHLSDEETGQLISLLKKDGFMIVAVEQAKNAIEYSKFRLTGKTLFIFGNEVEGASSKLLKLADLTMEIPMKGRKESLNVSVAVGVILFSDSSIDIKNT